MTTTAAKQAIGAYGESVARRHLSEQGLVVLDRNWRCERGEIDLVLRDGDVLVVCEVKTRSSAQSCGTPHEAVTDAKLRRLPAGHRVAGGARRPRRRRTHRPGGGGPAPAGARPRSST